MCHPELLAKVPGDQWGLAALVLHFPASLGARQGHVIAVLPAGKQAGLFPGPMRKVGLGREGAVEPIFSIFPFGIIWNKDGSRAEAYLSVS